MSLYFTRTAPYDEAVARPLLISLLLGLLALSPSAVGQFGGPGRTSPIREGDERKEDRLPNGSSRTLAMVKDDQQKSLNDVERILEAAKELEEDLAKSEFLVSLKAVERAEEIEALAKDIQGRLRRRR